MHNKLGKCWCWWRERKKNTSATTAATAISTTTQIQEGKKNDNDGGNNDDNSNSNRNNNNNSINHRPWCSAGIYRIFRAYDISHLSTVCQEISLPSTFDSYGSYDWFLLSSNRIAFFFFRSVCVFSEAQFRIINRQSNSYKRPNIPSQTLEIERLWWAKNRLNEELFFFSFALLCFPSQFTFCFFRPSYSILFASNKDTNERLGIFDKLLLLAVPIHVCVQLAIVNNAFIAYSLIRPHVELFSTHAISS